MNEVNLDEPNPHDLVPVTQSYAPDMTLWGQATPSQIIEKAAEAATALAQVVDKQGLFTNIQGRKHVRVEGWTLLGSILGVFPVCVWTRPFLDENALPIGWEARVEAHRNGQVVGAAEAQCLNTEKTWATRDGYALRSMAQTRATSKALRMPLGFVVTLAGYEACPAEEMDGIQGIAVPEAPQTPSVPLSEGTQEVLSIAAENRKKAAESITSTPEGRQRVRDAGFEVRDPEPKSQGCRKCGAEVKVYTAKAGHRFEQCSAARTNPAVYDEGGHSYRRLKEGM